jgi:hypothetical protein
MTVVVCGERPEVTELIERRRRLGQDRHDEVWEGAYHMAPEPIAEHGLAQFQIGTRVAGRAKGRGLVFSLTFNLGDGRDDFRIPDFGLHEGTPRGIWIRTAVVVGEVLSPDDETWQKFGFYARRGVEEVWVVDLDTRSVRVFVRRDAHGYDETDRSPRLDLSTAELAAIDWPG